MRLPDQRYCRMPWNYCETIEEKGVCSPWLASRKRWNVIGAHPLLCTRKTSIKKNMQITIFLNIFFYFGIYGEPLLILTLLTRMQASTIVTQMNSIAKRRECIWACCTKTLFAIVIFHTNTKTLVWLSWGCWPASMNRLCCFDSHWINRTS